MNDTGPIGADCYTSPLWNRDVCQSSRIDLGDWRFYRHDIGGTGVYRRGATYLSDKIMGLTGGNKYLLQWRKKMTKELGSEGFDQWMTNVADFGTQDHILYNHLIQGELTEELLWSVISNFANNNRLSNAVRDMAVEKAGKDLWAFDAFNNEHNVTVYAIEQMVTSERLCTSTPIDIVCTGDFQLKKGGRKERCWGLVNLKSSESKQNHEWQCSIEYWLARETIVEQCKMIEDLPVAVLTVRPKDWRDTPTFEVENYTEFAISDLAINTIPTVAEMLKNSGAFQTPNISRLSWEGPIGKGTKFIFQPIFV